MHPIYRAWLSLGTSGSIGTSQNDLRLESSSTVSGAPDVNLRVGPTLTHFSAHKNILSSHCGFFKAALASYVGTEPIVVPNVNVDEFSSLLTFMYTGFLDLNPSSIYAILLAAHILHMPRAIEICRAFLVQNQARNFNIVKPVPSHKTVLLSSSSPPPPPPHSLSFFESFGSNYQWRHSKQKNMEEDEVAFGVTMPSAKAKEQTELEETKTQPPPTQKGEEEERREEEKNARKRPIAKVRFEIERRHAKVTERGEEETRTTTATARGRYRRKLCQGDRRWLNEKPIDAGSQNLRRQDPEKEPPNGYLFQHTKATKGPKKNKRRLHASLSSSSVSSPLSPSSPSSLVVEEGFEIDVACCDGPVRFRRVLNRNFCRHTEMSVKTTSSPIPPPPPHAQPPENVEMIGEMANENAGKDGDYAFADEKAGGSDGDAFSFRCPYCNHAFKSRYCYQKHARRHLNPVVPDTVAKVPNASHNDGMVQREVRPLDLNVQYYPCKTCGSKFPSYYFVHKHRKFCHSNDDGNTEAGHSSSEGEPQPTTAEGSGRKEKEDKYAEYKPHNTGTGFETAKPEGHNKEEKK